MKNTKLVILIIFYCISQLVIAKQLTEKTDYIQIIFYGQSLAMGWDSPRAITTTADSGNYMLGDNVLMKYNNNIKALSPLIATQWLYGGEQPIVSCVNSFSKMYRDSIDPDQKFIAMTGGEGGQTIERLSKECSNSGYYYSTFLKILESTVSIINDKSVSCPAIIYMQGEFNCNYSTWYSGKGLTPSSNGTINKDEYKSLLLKLKNNMQMDIMTKFNQKQKPLFFIYQTSGSYIVEKEMPIAMAQLEFANENKDVVLLNPHNALPSYGGWHLSTNGYRWYGEIIAKTLFDVLIRKFDYKPLQPKSILIQSKNVTINYHVPAEPLVLDTCTNTKVANYGFVIYRNNIPVKINKIYISSGNTVIINTDIDLTGRIEVVYAGNTSRGTGNLRDSDNRNSRYKYFNDESDSKKETYTPTDDKGEKIYDKPYPLQNWSIGYYYKFNIEMTSLNDFNLGSKSFIYPNPSKSQVYLSYKLNGCLDGLLLIYNIYGNLIYQDVLSCKESQTVVNTKSFESGIYLYTISVNNIIIDKSKIIVI